MLEVAQMINLLPEVAAVLTHHGCWASKLQGNGSFGLGENSGAAIPQFMKQHRYLFFGGGNRGHNLSFAHGPFLVTSPSSVCLGDNSV